jgi:hypothetical protein
VETTERQITLRQLPVGAKLLVQCKKDWRTAVVSGFFEGRVTLIICSPSGRTYRKSCDVETLLDFDGALPLLGDGVWRETFVRYDSRW